MKMDLEGFCEHIKVIRESVIYRKDLAEKYPWHLNSIIAYEKDRLCDIDYLVVLSKESGTDLLDLIKLHLQVGMLHDHKSLTELLSLVDSYRGKVDVSEGAADQKNLDVFMCNDDSMSPMIQKGSKLYCDKSDKRLEYGKVYCINLAGQITPRLVQYGVDGQVLLVAENRTYVTIDISPEHINKIEIIGRLSRVETNF